MFGKTNHTGRHGDRGQPESSGWSCCCQGGMGVISTAQVGYDSPLFRENPEAANLQVLSVQIKKAKSIAGGKGVVAVNIMSVTQLYGEYVHTAVNAGVDAVISGAGLPMNLPEYVKDSDVKIAPIVSSRKAADIILRRWDKKYQQTADFLVMESPYSGGHQGFKKEELQDLGTVFANFEENVRQTVEAKKKYEVKYGKRIPLFMAGDVFTREDTLHAPELGGRRHPGWDTICRHGGV